MRVFQLCIALILLMDAAIYVLLWTTLGIYGDGGLATLILAPVLSMLAALSLWRCTHGNAGAAGPQASSAVAPAPAKPDDERSNSSTGTAVPQGDAQQRTCPTVQPAGAPDHAFLRRCANAAADLDRVLSPWLLEWLQTDGSRTPGSAAQRC